MAAAGNFGVPQGRWRVFMWTAAQGQQLPAIPKPTHNCVSFQASRAAALVLGLLAVLAAQLFGPNSKTPGLTRLPAVPVLLPLLLPLLPLLQSAVHMSAKRMTSGFTSEREVEAAHPPILLGDVLSDLPAVRADEGAPQGGRMAWLLCLPAPLLSRCMDAHA